METSRSDLLRPVLPDAALHGLAGDVARELSAISGADPASILVMFLTAFGNAVGRQPHVQFYKHDEAGRLYALIVGKWARGRKGTAWNAISQLFEQAEPEWLDKCIETGLQSPEAMIENVADGPYVDPRMLIKEDEFGRFIATMGSNRRFPAQMRTAYDGSTLSRKRVKQAPLISTQHHISLVGMITPGELIALQRLSGGLESRILYVYSAPGRKTDTDPFKEDDTSSVLAERVKSAIGHAWDNVLTNCGPISAELAELRGIPPNTRFPINDDVADNWKRTVEPMVEELADAVGEDFERYTARGQTHVIRLALLYALADEAEEIAWAHVEAAMALWEFCAFSARRIFSVPDDPKPRINPVLSGKVFDYLLDAYKQDLKEDGEDADPDELGWRTTLEVTKEALNKNEAAGPFLDDLEEQNLIVSHKVKTGDRGRPRVYYRVVIISLNSG